MTRATLHHRKIPATDLAALIRLAGHWARLAFLSRRAAFLSVLPGAGSRRAKRGRGWASSPVAAIPSRAVAPSAVRVPIRALRHV